MKSEISKAYKVAVKALRKNYSDLGILAGTKHFDDLWARDAMFASLGALELGDFKAVRKSLQNLLKYQREDGLLPYRVGTKSSILKLLGFRSKGIFPRYLDELGRSEVKDSNSLVVIIANEYLKKSKDISFAKDNFSKFKRALDYYGDYLIEERPYANWADSVPKIGKVLYTNVIFWKATVALEEIAKKIGRKYFSRKPGFLKRRISRVFWNGEYFRDSDSSQILSADGNVLAIVSGLANEKQKKSILESMKKRKMIGDHLSMSSPRYEEASNYHTLLGMKDYHNLNWLWVDALYGMIEKKMLQNVAKRINEYGVVYEIYEQNGKPVNRFFYKSERDFAWSAGLFIYAVRKIKLVK
jgi:glycogen debranching enzyme